MKLFPSPTEPVFVSDNLCFSDVDIILIFCFDFWHYSLKSDYSLFIYFLFYSLKIGLFIILGPHYSLFIIFLAQNSLFIIKNAIIH